MMLFPHDSADLSPYVEMAAIRCQAAENHRQAAGADGDATPIDWEQLETSRYVAPAGGAMKVQQQ